MGQTYICIMLFAETMDNTDRELLERVANAGKNILENLLKKTNIVNCWRGWPMQVNLFLKIY